MAFNEGGRELGLGLGLGLGLVLEVLEGLPRGQALVVCYDVVVSDVALGEAH